MKLFKRMRGELSCDDVMEVLQSYLDGETDANTARKVASHLDDCTDCDLESSVYQNLRVSLSTNKAPIDPVILDSLRQFGERVSRGEID